MKLYIHDDIEFMTPEEFDPPSLQDIIREENTAKAMALWADDYDRSMGVQRQSWLNQDHEGWGAYA